ncbi:MAG: hypothetical protein AB7S70_06860 [Hyphomicrobium sp.]|uniref:hypothetical protein n=1 Tax=Hyphomicrobium sp. TaxID=82 RepID=UPI003D110C29
MTKRKSALVALTAVLGAATMTASADAHGFGGGHFGGGHFGGGHIGHGGWGHGHYGRHGFYPAIGFYAPYYSSYYDDSGYGDCYRVYRYHRWRVVCDD